MSGEIDLGNGMQVRFDGGPLRFQERRQREPLPQGRDLFVDGKAWPISRNLEQDSPRLTEVDRVEVEPVDHRRHRRVDAGDPCPPFSLLLFIGSAESYMVNASDANEAAKREIRSDLQVHLGTRPTGSNLEHVHRGLFMRLVGTNRPEAKYPVRKRADGSRPRTVSRTA